MPGDFLSELTHYLQHVGERLVTEDAELPSAWARELLVRTLERAEAAFGDLDESRLSYLLTEWQSNNRIVHFVRRLDALLREGLGLQLLIADRRQLIEIGLARCFHIDEKLPSTVRTLELDRLVNEARGAVFEYEETSLDPGLIERYACAIHAVRRTPQGTEVTPIGRVFLDLVGRDAVRWLLHVEVTQSVGQADPDRVSREMVASLRIKQRRWLGWAEERFPFSQRIIERLVAMGLIELELDPEKGKTLLAVLPTSLELFAELEQTNSPLAVLANTLCSDLVDSAARRASDRDAAPVTAAAEATAHQARIVAHEIRNTLVPVSSKLNSLYREILLEPPAEVLKRRRAGIDRGIARVFNFVDQMVRVSSLAAAPPEVFGAGAALREAVALVEEEAAVGIEVSLSAQALPSVLGHRDRFIAAMLNLLRNSVQHGGPKLTVIRLAAEPIEQARALRITLDDDGQGVHESKREAVFIDGLSLSGGTGLGLALVREVIEQEMRGAVVCEGSPLGGARFTIRVPAAGVVS